MKKTNYFFQVLLLSLVMPICVPGTVIAAETDSYISEQDCAAIRDANGIAPKSIPADVAEQCKQIPLIVPAAGAAADPCAEGGGSIYCWGPWDTLAPAAYGGGQAPIEPLSGQDPRPELSTVFDKDLDPPLELPLDSCPAGSTSCGFATVIEGSAGSGNPDNTAVVNFAMTSDGSSFTVDPGNAGEIQSVNGMTTALAPRGGDDYILDSVGVESGQASTQVSQLQARVVSPDGTTLTSGSDFWANANIGTPTVVNSGYFVWGTSTSIETIPFNNLKNHLGKNWKTLNFLRDHVEPPEEMLRMFGIDTQNVLPFGTPGDVENEVKKRIADLAPGGGYVLSAVHNIQPDVRPENIVRMYESAMKYGKFPLTI